MIFEVADGCGKSSLFVDGVLVYAYHPGAWVAQDFFDFVAELLMDNSFCSAFRYVKLFRYGLIVYVFAVFVGDSFTESLGASLLGE
jgi:hypothetical protein